MSEIILSNTEDSLKDYSDECLVLELNYLNMFIGYIYEHSPDDVSLADDLSEYVQLLEKEILSRFCGRFNVGMVALSSVPVHSD